MAAPESYPPFAAVTDTDHTAWILIATLLGLVCSIVFAGITLLNSLVSNNEGQARGTGRGRGRGLDLSCLGASMGFLILQSVILLAACSSGLGKSAELVPETILEKTQKLYYISVLFSVLSLGLSKLSISLLLSWITTNTRHQQLFKTSSILVTLWTLGSALALALQCDLSDPWITIGRACSAVVLRMQLICVFDIVVEVGIVSVAAYVIGTLQMAKAKKSVLIRIFGLRILMVVFISFRLKTMSYGNLTTNPTLLNVKFIVWTQSEINYSVISAIIPSIRLYIIGLATSFGAKDKSFHNAETWFEMSSMQDGSSLVQNGAPIALETRSTWKIMESASDNYIRELKDEGRIHVRSTINVS